MKKVEEQIEKVMESVCETCRWPFVEMPEHCFEARCDACTIEAEIRDMMRQQTEERDAEREKAEDVLIAITVCSSPALNCVDHCPSYSGDIEKCNSWTHEAAKEAVEILLRMRKAKEEK